jgi:hypothetical protein
VFFLVAGLARVALVGAQTNQVVPAGEEFVANTFTFGRQTLPDVSMATDGSFIVVWQDGTTEPGLDGQDGSDGGIRGQRFDSAGGRIGAEFQVNINTLGSQQVPKIRHDAVGNVLIVWQDAAATGQPTVGRSFDPFLVPNGGEVELVPGPFRISDLQFQPNGDFIVASGGGSEGSNLTGQRFQLDGTPEGAEFQINTATYNTQKDPSIAVDGDGEFVVVWASDDVQFLAYNVKAQRFDAQGSKIGQEFQVNTYSTFRQWFPDVAMDSQGDFVVAWNSQKANPPDDLSPSAIQAQRFASDGSPVGVEFQVNSTTQTVEDLPQVAMRDDGSFIIAWETGKTPGDDVDNWGAIAGQQFDSDGNRVGTEFLVNTYTPLIQDQPRITSDGGDRFVVVWSDSGIAGYSLAEQDGSLNGVFGQRFENPIFADGFESGDTSSWSATSP